jgi:succinate dehydrogenase/fumarate reductase flavoprotein subunit
MERHQLIVVGGGIGGSAAVLRAAQHGLTVAWIRGDTATARASRACYVFNVDVEVRPSSTQLTARRRSGTSSSTTQPARRACADCLRWAT